MDRTEDAAVTKAQEALMQAQRALGKAQENVRKAICESNKAKYDGWWEAKESFAILYLHEVTRYNVGSKEEVLQALQDDGDLVFVEKGAKFQFRCSTFYSAGEFVPAHGGNPRLSTEEGLRHLARMED